MKSPVCRMLLFLLLIYVPGHCFAWGMLGHRITGEIAQHYLTSKAKREIAKILGNESIAMASNWADFIKSDSSYDYLYRWHFVNLKAGLNSREVKNQLETDTAVNAYNRLMFLIRELKRNDLEADKKQFYLRLLIHIVGDVHQPMHTGRPEDLGGNRIKVLWFNTPSNLHRVWDEQLLNFQQLSYTEYTRAINFPSKGQITEWQKQSVAEWLFDSYQISNRLYAQITKPEEALSYRYNYINLQTLNEQLLKGGIHLAGVLNDIFGSGSKTKK